MALILKINNFKNKNNLPQDFIQAIMDKTFKSYEKLSPDENLGGDVEFINEAIMEDIATGLHDYNNSSKNNQSSIDDKTLLSFKNISQKYPVASKDYWKIISVGIIESVSPEIFMKSLAEITANEDMDENLKKDVTYTLEEIYQRNPEYINEAIIKGLDFESPDSYAETIRVLDFLKKFYVRDYNIDQSLYSVRQDINKSCFIADDEEKDLNNEIQIALTEKIREKQGSYMLNLYTRDFLGEFDDWDKAKYGKKNRLALEEKYKGAYTLAPNLTGYSDNQKLFIAEKKGENMREISINDIRKVKKDEGELNLKDERFLENFKFLSRPEIRKVVFKDFGISLSKMPLVEQANFLQFLATRKEDGI